MSPLALSSSFAITAVLPASRLGAGLSRTSDHRPKI
jgi:hypothetical protein